MLTAYVLARQFVFDPSGRAVISELKRFAIVNAFSAVLVWPISVGLARHLFPAIGFAFHPEDIAHFVGVATPEVLSYQTSRVYLRQGKNNVAFAGEGAVMELT